jgi:hypothetical protein
LFYTLVLGAVQEAAGLAALAHGVDHVKAHPAYGGSATRQYVAVGVIAVGGVAGGNFLALKIVINSIQ